MIISHLGRYVFVKTVKTAGTSVEVTLARSAGDDAVVTPVFPAVAGHAPRNHLAEVELLRRTYRDVLRDREDRRELFGEVLEAGIDETSLEHLPARAIEVLHPREFSEYTSFCIVRNPYDTMVSAWFDFRHRTNPDISFADFLPIGLVLFGSRAHYTDATGEVMVDHVLRYENLDAELGKVMGRLGLPYDGFVAAREKASYRPPADDHRRHYDAERRAMVAARFAWELDRFGYEF